MISGLAFQGEVKLDMPITGVNYDSRKVEPGNIFVCISGFKVDGHQYIADAISKGAVGIVAEKEIIVPEGIEVINVENTRKALPIIAKNFYKNPASKFNLIGVTGTNGKTTTTFLIEAILREYGQKVGLIGTIENRIGDQSFPTTHTTPESLDLQRLFSVMAAEVVTYGVMEVSSHALDLGRVDGVEYDVAVFTNLTQDHLDYHPNMDEYLQAKAILFNRLGETNIKGRAKYCVINGDDPYGKLVAAKTKAPIITYGIKPTNDIFASQVEIKATGVSFVVNYNEIAFTLELKLTGLFSVYNALAACTVGLQEKIEPEIIKRALEQLTGVAGRFESVIAGQDFAVIVDYAHTPDSLENILLTAKEFAKRNIITVFGCGGDRDRTKRPLMGEKVAQYSNYCIITADNPRTEDPKQIIADIIPGVSKHMKQDRYTVIENREAAIHQAINMATTDDIVIIAGKGHETYQIIGDTVFPFDDRIVAREALEKRGYGNG